MTALTDPTTDLGTHALSAATAAAEVLPAATPLVAGTPVPGGPGSAAGFAGAAIAELHLPGAPRIAVEANQRRDMVDHRAARHQCTDLGRQACDLQPRDVARQMLGVASDRPHHKGLAAACRVEQPAQPVVLRVVFEAHGQAALDVLNLHQAHCAQGAVAQVPARVWFPDDGDALLVTAAAYADELAGRLR